MSLALLNRRCWTCDGGPDRRPRQVYALPAVWTQPSGMCLEPYVADYIAHVLLIEFFKHNYLFSIAYDCIMMALLYHRYGIDSSINQFDHETTSPVACRALSFRDHACIANAPLSII